LCEGESLSGRKVRRLRTDHAYESSAWRDYCLSHGIVHEFTAPYSSAQNGLAERAIRTTIDDVRTLLHDSGLVHSYWAEDASYSVFTRNLIPSRRHPGTIPLQALTGQRQDVSHLRVFGTRCWAKILTVNGAQVTGGSKLNPRGVECHFLGYVSGAGNYKVQEVLTCHVPVSWDVVFEEGQPRRTSLNVGEKNLPLFDTTMNIEGTKTSSDNQQTTNQQNTVTDPVSDDPRDHQIDLPTVPIMCDHHNDIPEEPIHQTELCCSSRVSQPSAGNLQSSGLKSGPMDRKKTRTGPDWTGFSTRPWLQLL